MAKIMAKKDHTVTINRLELEELERKAELLDKMSVNIQNHAQRIPHYNPGKFIIIPGPTEVTITVPENIFPQRPNTIVLVDESGDVVSVYEEVQVKVSKGKWFQS